MTRDRISGTIFIAIALIVVWESRIFPFGAMDRPGPGFVPILLAVGLGIAGSVVLAYGGKSPSFRSIKWPEWRHVSAILFTCVFMALALERLGYRITVVIMLAFLLGVVERRGIVTALTLSLGAAFGTYWLFNDILRVLLPQGILGF
jgi:putative tricarboxylic transport membrane protein